MSKHQSKEAYFQRLRELAEVKKPSLKESTRNLGTLIDYKRAADGVAYGIVKEQHHYYLKKAGTKQDPNVSDFAYIGGLANITEYQYKKLSEADKHRSMILHTINEGLTNKPSLSGSKKKKLNEDKAGDEIEQADQKASELDAATAAEAEPEVADMGGEEEMAAGLEAEPAGMEGGEVPAEEPAGEVPAEEPAPEGGEEVPAEEPAGDEDAEAAQAIDDLTGGAEDEEGGEEPTGEEGGEEVPAEEPADDDIEKGPKDEIKSDIGKLGEKLQQKTLNSKQVTMYVEMFLGYFKEYFADMPVDETKELAKKITEVSREDNIKDLEASMPSEPVTADGETGVEEEACAECGSFGKYAESRGYTQDSIQECGEEELGNVVSGYANAYNDGQNDGDFKMVALLLTPEMLSKLKDEYGHEEYAEKLEPEVNSLAECKLEEKKIKIAELWGGNTDTNNVTTQPDMLKEDDESEEEEELEIGGEPEEEEKVDVDDTKDGMIDGIGKGGAIGFAPEQSLGGGVVKPDGAAIEIKVTPDKTVNIQMSESEKKLRKYIRERLEVKAGLKREKLTEGKKSPTLKKLDAVIDQQFKLYESALKKK